MVFVIAEAGVNHNGNLETAKKLIEVAAQAGCNAIKFQTFQTEQMIAKTAKQCNYQTQNTKQEETQFDMVKRLELPYAFHQELIDHCKQHDIAFLSAPFDIPSVLFLHSLGLDTFKIPSGEITNLPYLEAISQLGKHVILSTGMATLNEIENALLVLSNCLSVTLLHCNTDYPTKFNDVNLLAMVSMGKKFGVPVGYSDHTLGETIPIAAVALGATVIEKHITLDKTLKGPDQVVSMEPTELRHMVQAIRDLETAMGDGQKRPSVSELTNKPHVRKSIVAKTRIQKGEVFSEYNCTTKRPETGISPMLWHEVMGSVAKRDYEEDETIEMG